MKQIIRYLAHADKDLKKKLKMAHIKKTPEEYIKKLINGAITYALFLAVIAFFPMGRSEIPQEQQFLILLAVFVVALPLCYKYMALSLDAEIKKREGDINKEVIFAGRFLLVKLESGMPLFNALIEGSKSYGVASKYFKEIVDEINLGTPIEDALENAMRFTPSDKFKKILFQINNALKLGIDVTTSLKSILKELVAEQNSEIKAYGKKLSSVAMFYMLGAIVVPSLGMMMLVVVTSFIGIDLGLVGYTLICILLAFVQMVFISTFRSIRPNVNL
jgi:flagellar protein FlaJ